MERGKLIVIYGINNLGKSTQAEMLVDWLKQRGIRVRYIKYPIYELEPFGPIINNYLREGNSYDLSPREFQMVQALNRTQFDAELKKELNKGTWIVAEDYVGTSIAWGAGAGVNQEFLEKINSHLHKEDLAFLLWGKRFTSGIENGHKHEQNNELTCLVQRIHMHIGSKNGWIGVNANGSIDEIHKKITNTISNKFNLQVTV